MQIYILNETDSSIGESYAFRGPSGRVRWPKTTWGLGPAGAWNLFWRLGYHPQVVGPDQVVECARGDLIVASPDTRLSTAAAEALNQGRSKGASVLASGPVDGLLPLIPGDGRAVPHASENPYAGLAWLDPDGGVELMAPPQQACFRLLGSGEDNSRCWGRLAEVRGEFHSPGRAILRPVPDAPAVWQSGTTTLLNGDVFASFQAWLQNHLDLGPWLNWRHRTFWLDELAGYLHWVLRSCSVPLPHARPGIEGLGGTTVVLRHDLDSSTDLAYLHAENDARLAGVHAVLLDSNRDYWLKELRNSPGHEIGFHFDTTGLPTSSGRLARRIRKLAGAPLPPGRAARRAFGASGLLTQVNMARRAGIPTRTLHRHAGYLPYPEWVDALDAVFERQPEILGSSSAFRAQVLRWGADYVDNRHATVGQFPDPQFPLWYPFRLCHAARGGKLLRGWESTSVMELEAEHVGQLLDHRIEGLQQKVVTLNYHPAHASRSTFAPGGGSQNFCDLLRLLKQKNVQVCTLAEVYRRASASTERVERANLVCDC